MKLAVKLRDCVIPTVGVLVYFFFCKHLLGLVYLVIVFGFDPMG